MQNKNRHPTMEPSPAFLIPIGIVLVIWIYWVTIPKYNTEDTSPYYNSET